MFTKTTKKADKKTTSTKKAEVENNRDKDFKELLGDLAKCKNIRGYIVLVDEQDEEERKSDCGRGINAVNGNGHVLCNLLANLNPELLKSFELWQTINSERKSMEKIDALLKDVLRLVKDE